MLVQVGGRARRFKGVEMGTGARPLSGQPVTAATAEAKDMVDALIVDHHRFTCELRAALEIGRPTVMTMIIELGIESFAQGRC
jgi:hypothetical protein